MIARAASAAASCACLAARATRRPRTSFARRLANMSAAWRDVKFGASGAPGVEVGDASAPAVCLLQEWWGVTLEIKAIGEKLHGVGYRVLIPDLYNGKLGLNAEEASHQMDSLDWPKALKEICEATAYLSESGSPAVGVTGTCMGGALTLAAAQHAPHVKCAAPFYGVPDPGLCDTRLIAVPVQGHFGELDSMAGFSDPAAAKALEEALAGGACPEGEVFIYSGVGHGFLNQAPDKPRITADVTAETGFPKADTQQQEKAWTRLLAFFDKHLR